MLPSRTSYLKQMQKILQINDTGNNIINVFMKVEKLNVSSRSKIFFYHIFHNSVTEPESDSRYRICF